MVRSELIETLATKADITTEDVLNSATLGHFAGVAITVPARRIAFWITGLELLHRVNRLEETMCQNEKELV